jgi:hypothetical protein
MLGLTAEGAAGGHVDDPPAAPRDHVPDRAPDRVRGAGQVHRQRVLPGCLPLLVGPLGDRLRGVDACVVHQYVQAAQTPRGLIHQSAHRVRVGQVGLDNEVTAAGQGGQYLGGRPSRVAVVHRDPVTLARERLRHGCPDAPVTRTARPFT